MSLPDIDELREMEIRLHGLTRADRRYTFCYDETNNIRKLRVGTNGLNVGMLKTFVLGGVVHEGLPHALDIEALRSAIRIQKTAIEIKLEHVAGGDFLKLLESAKLTSFLRWVTNSGLMIHYMDVDPLYWSIVDIIDSILAGLEEHALYPCHAILKGDLVAVLRNDLRATVDLFYRYHYPGLTPGDRTPFLNDLIALTEDNCAILPESNAMTLKGVLQAGRGLDSLAFIEGETPNLLIDSFSGFYLNRLAVFKYSNHVLGMEEAVRERFAEMPLTSAGKPVTHYRFTDSKAEPGIQIADVIVGLLGKMHSYLIETAPEEIAATRASLTGTSLQNTKLLHDLIDASDATNIAFLHHVTSAHDLEKLDLFLHFRDGSYAI
jgi:hypothetical protein